MTRTVKVNLFSPITRMKGEILPLVHAALLLASPLPKGQLLALVLEGERKQEVERQRRRTLVEKKRLEENGVVGLDQGGVAEVDREVDLRGVAAVQHKMVAAGTASGVMTMTETDGEYRTRFYVKILP